MGEICLVYMDFCRLSGSRYDSVEKTESLEPAE